MSLGKSLVAAIHETTGTEAKTSGGQLFERTLEGYNFEIGLRDFDKYTFLLDGLTITTRKTDSDAPLSAETLKARAQQLSQKVTYFLEDLKLLEVDAIKLQAQMRSESPSLEKTSVSYFEVMIQGNSKIALQRYQYDPETMTRQQVPFLVTNEVFERCINDFLDILQK